jgi:hypothetical protein
MTATVLPFDVSAVSKEAAQPTENASSACKTASNWYTGLKHHQKKE